MDQIRKMQLEDVDTVYKLGKITKEFKLSDKTWFYERNDLLEMMDSSNYINLVSYRQRMLTGFLLAQQMSSSWVQLNNIVVKPAYKGKGIARLLLNEFDNELEKREIKYVSGIVSKNSDDTRRFWKYQGFNEGKEFIWIEKFL